MVYPHYSIIVLVSILLASCSDVVVAFDGRKLSLICSGKLFYIGSVYDYAVEDTLNDLISNTWKYPELDYYCKDTHKAETFVSRDVTLYGHAVCTSSLSPDDCHGCIWQAYKEMFKECTHSIGAQVDLVDCHLRYENYKFNNDL